MAPDSDHNSESGQSIPGDHQSIWTATSSETSHETLPEDGVIVDTAVVGGGIVGITAASQLKEEGQSVAVIESDRIIEGVTAHSTAKLTSLHGLIYQHLLSNFGEAKARQYAEANQAAIDHVESRVEEHDIEGDFHRTAAYTYTISDGKREKIAAEVDAAKQLGLPASYTDSTLLPWEVEAAVKFEDQAHFNPREYLLNVAREIPDDDCHIFEQTTAQDITPGTPSMVTTSEGTVTAENVIVATHFPFWDHGLYYARLSPMRSYVLAARLNEPAPEGLFYRPGNPYLSVRPRPTGDESMVLIAGQNHRTGHGHHATEKYRKLEREAKKWFDVAEIEYRWSTQDYNSVDQVPFVGQLSPKVENVYVATGFGGWGLSNGTAAGILLADQVCGRANDWSKVYDPLRFKPKASKEAFSHQNEHAVKHYLEDYSTELGGEGAKQIPKGEAKVFGDRSNPLAVYHDEDGDVHAVSAVCTHMDCLVNWNDAEGTWDCPCHGSRFDHDGTVLDGPALDSLPEREPEVMSDFDEL